MDPGPRDSSLERRPPRLAWWIGGCALLTLMGTGLLVWLPWHRTTRLIAEIERGGSVGIESHHPEWLDALWVRCFGEQLRFIPWLDHISFVEIKGVERPDELLRRIGSCRRLTIVSIQGGAVSNEGFGCLRGSAAIESLWLSNVEMSEAALADIGALTSLTGLRILQPDIPADRRIDDRGVAHLATLSNLQTLSLMDVNLTGSGLRRLSKLTQLEGCDFAGTGLTDDDLQHLPTAPDLQWLGLSNTQITDAGLVHLSRFSSLSELDLDRTGVRGTGLPHLSALPLEWLMLSESQVDDEGLAGLAGLSHLARLELNQTAVTGTGFEPLVRRCPIRTLELSAAPVTDVGASVIARLPQLQELDISRTQVTDAGVAAFATCPRLESLSTFDTAITSDALTKLNHANKQIGFPDREVGESAALLLNSPVAREIEQRLGAP